jgi:hypothetical protein
VEGCDKLGQVGNLDLLGDGGAEETAASRHSQHLGQHLQHTSQVVAAFWIRMYKDPHNFGNLDLHPHQIKSRIRIKIYKLDPEPDLDPH